MLPRIEDRDVGIDRGFICTYGLYLSSFDTPRLRGERLGLTYAPWDDLIYLYFEIDGGGEELGG